MRISELVETLNKLKYEYGDLDVYANSEHGKYQIIEVSGGVISITEPDDLDIDCDSKVLHIGG